MKNRYLYKHRPLEDDFQRKIVADIISGKIFVSASFHFLDPLENLHLTDDGLKKLDGNFGIVSFTDDPLQPEVWSKYAFWHRGVCFGFCSQVAPQLRNAKAVEYVENYSSSEAASLEEKLLVKPIQWQQEAEWRIVFGERQKEYIELPTSAILEVTFGAACTDDSEAFVREKLEEQDLQPTMYRCELANTGGFLTRALIE